MRQTLIATPLLLLSIVIASGCEFRSQCALATHNQTDVILTSAEALPPALYEVEIVYEGREFVLEADLRGELCASDRFEERPGSYNRFIIDLSLCTDGGHLYIEEEASSVPQKDISMTLRSGDDEVSVLAAGEFSFEVVDTCAGPFVSGTAAWAVELGTSR